MEADRKETMRYLGYRGQEISPETLQMIEEVTQELEQASSPKSIYREYDCQVSGDEIKLGELKICSRNLAANLKGCERAVLLAATIGPAADFMIRKYSVLSLAKAAVVQAAGAACIESYVDEVEDAVRQDAGKRNLYLRPRFSPGYGDFSLECQPALLGCLEAGKRIGITLTDSLLMAPSKSVTAVIGISRIPGTCGMRSCQDCEKRDCAYRRT